MPPARKIGLAYKKHLHFMHFFFRNRNFFWEGPPFPHVTVSDHYVSVRVSKKVKGFN